MPSNDSTGATPIPRPPKVASEDSYNGDVAKIIRNPNVGLWLDSPHPRWNIEGYNQSYTASKNQALIDARKKEIDYIADQLKSVDAAYKIPENLMYKRSAQVGFVLEVEGKGSSISTLADLPGRQADAKVAIARFVRAKLTGAPDMVKITLRGGEGAERQYAQFKNVEWIWDVEGLQVGQVDLNLQLLAEVSIDGKAEPLQIRTFQKRIPVQISFMDSAKVWAADVMSFWPFLTAVVSAGAGGLALFGFKKRRSNGASFDK